MPNWLHSVLADAAGIRGREVIPKTVTVANPSVGADWNTLIPGGVAWVVMSIRATYATSAVVGTRFPNLEVSDGNQVMMSIPASASISASATVPYTWIRDLGAPIVTSGSARATNTIWSFPLLGGWTISTSTVSKDVNDQWSSIILFVLEIEETPYDIEVTRDLSNLAGSRSDAVPQLGLE